MANVQLQPVLDRIDADFDNSLDRLFALLRIKSISAQPAHAADCATAAAWWRDQLAGQTRLDVTAADALTTVRAAWSAALGDTWE